jgi:hypothetical protein
VHECSDELCVCVHVHTMCKDAYIHVHMCYKCVFMHACFHEHTRVWCPKLPRVQGSCSSPPRTAIFPLEAEFLSMLLRVTCPNRQQEALRKPPSPAHSTCHPALRAAAANMTLQKAVTVCVRGVTVAQWVPPQRTKGSCM